MEDFRRHLVTASLRHPSGSRLSTLDSGPPSGSRLSTLDSRQPSHLEPGPPIDAEPPGPPDVIPLKRPRRWKMITVRLSAAQHQALLDEAWQHRISLNRLCVEKLLGGQRDPRDEEDQKDRTPAA